MRGGEVEEEVGGREGGEGRQNYDDYYLSKYLCDLIISPSAISPRPLWSNVQYNKIDDILLRV